MEGIGWPLCSVAAYEGAKNWGPRNTLNTRKGKKNSVCESLVEAACSRPHIGIKIRLQTDRLSSSFETAGFSRVWRVSRAAKFPAMIRAMKGRGVVDKVVVVGSVFRQD